MQVPFKKPLRKALQDTAALAKNKLVSTEDFKFLNLFRKQSKPI